MTRADIIEAAARTWWERGQARRMDAGRLGDDGLPLRWEDVHEDVRHADRLVVPENRAAPAGNRGLATTTVEES